jgi:hypothetical protein
VTKKAKQWADKVAFERLAKAAEKREPDAPEPATGQTVPPVAQSAVPEYIQQAKVYKRRKLSKRKVGSFEEAMLLLHLPELARGYFSSLLEGLKARDKSALDHTGQILNYVQQRGLNISVTQQLLQQNTVAGPDSPVVGYDAFVRRLGEARGGELPSGNVITVEPNDTAFTGD